MEHEGGDTTSRTTAELLGATPSMVDSTSAELLRIAENGGLAKNVRYTYKGKLVKFFRVRGDDYAKAVGEFRMQRKYGRRQIGFRVCQLVTFTLTVITIAVGTWALTVYVFDAMQYGFLDEAVPAAEQLRPAIPRLEKVSSVPTTTTLCSGGAPNGCGRKVVAHLVSLNVSDPCAAPTGGARPHPGGGHSPKRRGHCGRGGGRGPKRDGRHQLQRNSRVRERCGQKCDERGGAR